MRLSIFRLLSFEIFELEYFCRFNILLIDNKNSALLFESVVGSLQIFSSNNLGAFIC